MIRKIAKPSLGLFTAIYFLFLSLFGLGDFFFPDRISRFDDEPIGSVLFFSPEEEALAASVTFSSSPREETVQIRAFGILPIKTVQVRYYPKDQVLCGGELIGIKMKTQGLFVASFGAVQTTDGTLSPGEAAGLKKGDVILECNGVELDSATDFAKLVSKSGSSRLSLTVKRGEETLTKTLTPVLAADGSGWKAGLWVRDGAAGIGTVTFRDPVTGAFAGLGHAVCDAESKTPFPLQKGSVCEASIETILKGENGKAGEIRGKLTSTEVGTLCANTPQGVFGTITTPSSHEKSVPIGLKDEVKTGKATILSTLDQSGKKEYEIEIQEILSKDRDAKNFIIHVTDPDLIAKTGGIIQGMSGSPIIQNGKLIGAVTHVLVGDPTRGYGIFIENMLSTMPE